MKKLLYGVLGFLTLCVGLLFLAPYFINLNHYKSEIHARAHSWLGRDLKIEGDIRFSILPFPSLTLKDVKLANLTGAAAPYMATLEEITLNVNLKALLKKKLEVTKIIIQKPHVFLEKTSSGVRNWDFPVLQATSRETIPSEPSPSKNKFDFSFNDIEVIQGHFSYKDPSAFYVLENVTAQLAVDGLEGPYSATGFFKFQTQPVKFKIKVKEVRSSSLPIDLKLESGGTEAQIEGTMNLNTNHFEGQTHLEGDMMVLEKLSPSLEIPSMLKPFIKDDLHFESHLQASPEHIQFTNFGLKIANEEVKGNIQIDLVPLKGTIQVLGFPGKTRLEVIVTQKKDKLSGHIKVTSQQINKLLDWAHIKTKAVPPIFLKSLMADTSFSYGAGTLDLQEVDVTFHKTKMKGNFKADLKNSTYTYNLKAFALGDLLKELGGAFSTDPGVFQLQGTTKGTVATLYTDTHMKIAGLSCSLKGEIQNLLTQRTYRLKTEIGHPHLSTFLKLLQDTPPALPLGTFTLEAVVQGHPKTVTFSGLKVKIHVNKAPLSFSGQGSVTQGKKPFIQGVILLSPIDVTLLGGGDSSSSALSPSKSFSPKKSQKSVFHPMLSNNHKEKITISPPPWSQKRLNLSFLTSFEAHLKIRIPQIKKEDLILKKFSTELHVKEGGINISQLAAKIFGGAFSLGAHLAPQGRNYSLDSHFHLKNARLKRVIKSTGEVKITQGMLNLSSDLKTVGASVFDLISHLRGLFNFTAEKGVLNGFNLRALSTQLKKMTNLQDFLGLFKTYMEKGQTSFKRFEGNIEINQGIGTFRNLILEVEGGNGTGSGTLDLPKYTMNVQGDLRLTDHPDLPPFKIRLQGPLDNPQKIYDTSALQKYMIQNIFKSLLNKDLLKGNILKKILPTDPHSDTEKVSPTPDSSGSQDSNSDPTKVLQNPQKALEGLLKGLL